MSFLGGTAAKKPSAQDQDVQANTPPGDSVSSICMNGNAQTAPTALVATAWDNSVTCYQIQQGQAAYGQAPPMAVTKMYEHRHEAPALCCDFSSDSTTVFSGGCDGVLKQWNISQGAAAVQAVGRHDQPIRCLKFLQSHNVVVTGGWDKQIRVWDLRSPTPAMTVGVCERVYAMDCKGDVVVVGTADKQITVMDIRSQQKQPEYKSPLNYQTRCISIFEDNTGFAVGCIEGRVAIEYYAEMAAKRNPIKPTGGNNFVFKCHRDKQDIFAVNAIHFHQYNTFVTAGSDGVMATWDKDSRSRLANFDLYNRRVPVADCKFSANGAFLAYALSYDWSRGSEHAGTYTGMTAIMLHALSPTEIQPKKK